MGDADAARSRGAIRLADSDRLWVAARRGDRRASSARSRRRDRRATRSARRGRRREPAFESRATQGPQHPRHGVLQAFVEKISETSARSKRREEQVREGEPAARRVDRAPVQPRAAAAHRPDSGGQHRPDEGRRAVRPHARLPLLDVRVVVDPSRDQPRPGRQGARGPHPGAHARHAQPRRRAPRRRSSRAPAATRRSRSSSARRASRRRSSTR